MSLLEQRKKKGLTQEKLAELSGVHPMKILQIEKGVLKPENITLRNALKLAKALGCHPRDILDRDIFEDEPEKKGGE